MPSINRGEAIGFAISVGRMASARPVTARQAALALLGSDSRASIKKIHRAFQALERGGVYVVVTGVNVDDAPGRGFTHTYHLPGGL